MSTSSSKTPKIVLGIDLGTVNARARLFEQDKLAVDEPSCVFVESQERFLVGETAKTRLALQPKRTVFGAFKQLLGRSFADVTKSRFWPFEVVSHHGRPMIEASDEDSSNAVSLPPHELYAVMLAEMKSTAERHLNMPVTDCIVTVPVAFNFKQRLAVREAASKAKLNVLRLIDDSTAAAIAYCHLQEIRHLNEDEAHSIIVIDIGGYFLNVSLVDVLFDSVVEVKATAGESNLGGEAFTDTILAYLLEEFAWRHGKDISSNTRAVQRLRRECERVKIVLSTSEQATIDVVDLVENVNFKTVITREKFEQLNHDLFLRIFNTVRRVVSKFPKSNLDDIVLIGGSSRIPKLEAIFKEFFIDKNFNISMDRHTSVADGAAIQAALLSRKKSEDLDRLLLVDVLPWSIGVKTGDGDMTTLIARDTTIPTRTTQIFTNSLDQATGVVISVFEGENEKVRNNLFLGEFLFEGIKPQERSKSEIEVTLSVSSDSNVITVTVRDVASGLEKEITFGQDEVHFFHHVKDSDKWSGLLTRALEIATQ